MHQFAHTLTTELAENGYGTVLGRCLLTLATMIYLASHPSIGQTLRLNQD